MSTITLTPQEVSIAIGEYVGNRHGILGDVQVSIGPGYIATVTYTPRLTLLPGGRRVIAEIGKGT